MVRSYNHQDKDTYRSWFTSKWMKSISGVVCIDWAIQAMLFGKPALGSERSAVMKVARAASESKVCEVNYDLIALKYQSM